MMTEQRAQLVSFIKARKKSARSSALYDTNNYFIRGINVEYTELQQFVEDTNEYSDGNIYAILLSRKKRYTEAVYALKDFDNELMRGQKIAVAEVLSFICKWDVEAEPVYEDIVEGLRIGRQVVVFKK